MPELNLVDVNNNKVGTVQASPKVFESKIHEHLVHHYAVMQLARRRSGTASTKSSYGELSGSGKKPWKQKGTGRARAGSTRSALWRGGLTTFGPTPRDFGIKLSKKNKRLALRSVLTERVQQNAFHVVDKIALDQPKTKEAVQLLKTLGLTEKTLFVIAEKNPNLELAVRNIPNVDVLLVDGLNVYDILNHGSLICTPEAVKMIEERLGK